MAKPNASSSERTRPLSITLPLTTLLLLHTLLAIYIIRIEPFLTPFMTNYNHHMQSALLNDGTTPLKTSYTGLRPVDYVLKGLVVAFWGGPGREDEEGRMLQGVFLVQLCAVVVVMNVEGCRARNRWGVLGFQALWALHYQLIGGGCVMPLYFAAHAWISRKSSYPASGQEVDVATARALWPAVFLLYVPATVAMVVQWGDPVVQQNVIAFWQTTPVLINGLIWILASTIFRGDGSPTAAAAKGHGYVKHLDRLYDTAAGIGAAVHLGSLYIVFTSTHPQLGFSHVFLPVEDVSDGDLTRQMHRVFQWDYITIFGAALVLCWLAVYDVRRSLGTHTASAWVLSGVAMVLGAVVVGPAAVIALAWKWREAKLEQIAERRLAEKGE